MERQAEYVVREAPDVETLLRDFGVRRNSNWREYERGKAIVQGLGLESHEYDRALQVVVDWVFG